MATVNAYLNFNGKCRQAMNFYHAVFGGELMVQRISESPMAAQMPASMADQVLHAVLEAGGILIMGSDMIGTNLESGNSIALCINCADENELHAFFDGLSGGGKVITQPHQSFWGAMYGELQDKFGYNWMLNYSKIKS